MRICLAILKHNLENFSLDILEYCLPKDVIKREQYYLDIYKPIYNTLKIAGSSSGYVHNETSLAKIRKAMGIPVKVINIDNKKITIYPSKKEAGLHLNTSNTTIGNYMRSGKLLFGKYLITKIG